MKTNIMRMLLALAVMALMAACTAPPPSILEQQAVEKQSAQVVAAAMATIQAQTASDVPEATAEPVMAEEPAGEPNVSYTLVTGGEVGGLVFVGQGGDIDGVVNPTLNANPGDIVQITLINKDGIMHDLAIDEFSVMTPVVDQMDQEVTVKFTAVDAVAYVYYCSQPGHRQAGMFGTLQVGEPVVVEVATGEDIIHNPADIPAPIGARGPETVRVDLVAKEVTGQLADGTTYDYYTFNGSIPGPMIRVREGDTIELHLSNDAASGFAHSIDLHAVTGPGGGAVYTQTNPGEETMFTFKALKAGLYVYHCATPSVAHHISSGMYGMILVEPEGGLAPVDEEFYVMQGELYTQEAYGTQGHLTFDEQKLLNETPEYFVFNGAAAGLTTEENALHAKVGDTVRIFFGVGGPNFVSSFHVIGEIFDRVYPFASFASPPLEDVQTVIVPTGGATMVEFTVEVPGRYILVDHSLSRLERGLVAFLFVEGDENPDIYKGPEN